MTEITIGSAACRVELAAGMHVSARIAELAVGEKLAGQRRVVEGAVGVGARRVELAAVLALGNWLGCVGDGNAN